MQFDQVHFHGEDEGEDQDSLLFELTDEDYLQELLTLETSFPFPNDYGQEDEYNPHFTFLPERLDEAEEIDEFAFLPHQNEVDDGYNATDEPNQVDELNPYFEREQLDWMNENETSEVDTLKEEGIEEEEEEEAELDYSKLSVGEYTEDEKRMFMLIQ